MLKFENEARWSPACIAPTQIVCGEEFVEEKAAGTAELPAALIRGTPWSHTVLSAASTAGFRAPQGLFCGWKRLRVLSMVAARCAEERRAFVSGLPSVRLKPIDMFTARGFVGMRAMRSSDAISSSSKYTRLS